MNGFIEDIPSSPTEAGNFIIPFSEEVNLIQNIQTDNFLQFLKNEKSVETGIISGTDQSFFPRAITDLNTLEIVEMDMEERDNGGFDASYQPDVIMTNSHQRSGPDGSPALVTAISQRFAAPANLSESGELFAPVRTLTFSDIDQSSHVEDSYFDSSRLVSTPNKTDKGKFGNNHYDYSSLTANRFQTIENNENIGADSDSSDSDNLINGARDSVTPEFRQLEGEADNDLANTGPFHPSTHGLSKEFMDNFVGKTGNQEAMCDNNDIFSPLGSNYHMQERRVLSKTPPLHSPGPSSPYSKSCNSPRGQKSSRFEQSPRSRPSPKGQVQHRQDLDEIQFDISPSKDQPSGPSFNSETLGKGIPGEKFYYGNVVSSHSFMPVEKPTHSFDPATIPKNLNEYFDQVTNDQFIAQRFNTINTSGYHSDKSEMTSRQGDGSDNDLDDRPQKLLPPPDAEALVPEKTSQPLESKYLQKTQVSVKLPQATYDTISADERFTIGDQHHSKSPDVAAADDDGIDNTAHTRGQATSGGKVMDLLKNQVGQSDQNAFNSCMDSGSIDHMSGDRVVSMENDKHSNQIDSKSKGMKNGPQDNDTAAQVPDSLQKSAENIESQNNSNITKVKSNEKALNQITEGSNTNLTQSNPEKTDPDSSVASQGSSQSQSQVSSRLYQETVSQRNKTTQKFVSSAPTSSKSYTTSQGKDFKKPNDSVPKNSVVCSGSRKLSNDSGVKKPATIETCPKFKASDRSKPKFVSNEALNQKSKYLGNQSRNMQNFNDNPSQSKLCNQNSSASSQGQGQSMRGQIMNKGQGKARAFSGDGHTVHSDDEGHGQGRIVTQVENTSPVAVEQPSQTRNIRQVPGLGDSSLDIKGMEEVRHQLQSMMKMSYEQMNAQDRTQYEHSDIIAGFGVELGDQHRLTEKSWNHFRNPGEDDLMDNFPSFSSQYFTDSGNVSRAEASVHTENQRLRDMLEKERYRRKHCEQYIQQLNVKLLETQQQVAVAVSTDKRKDLMIEQLDKQLARVMEGWKKRDQEKDDLMSDIQKEKEEIENNMKQQQKMISNFEHDMSEAVEALRQEKEKAAQDLEQLKDRIQSVEHDKQHAEELVEAEKEKGDLLQQECENLRESRETLDKKLDQMQKRLHREQDDWFQREQELLQRIDEVSEKTSKVLQVERAKNEEQGKLAEEIMDQYQSAVTKVKKLEMDLDAAHREKESLKVEMGIMEAKFENDQRVLEADLSSTMEKRIAEQICDVQRRHEAMVDDLQENHREQMLELSVKNGKDMEMQLGVFRKEIQKKEEEHRKQLQELETRLTEYRNENAELKRSKQKLESTRLEILTKLQYAMQTQWNEALSMLSATPQRMQTRSRTQGSAEDASSTLQSSPAVNFSFFAPSNQSVSQHSVVQPPSSSSTPPKASATNLATPPRQSTSHATFDRTLANQISPVPRHLSNQDRVAISSPGGESIVSHSTERDPTDHLEATVETAAMSHMRQFQDYMNSFAKTPEWISSMAGQSEAFSTSEVSQNAATSNIQQMSVPQLTSPSDITTFFSTHLQKIQQYQQLLTMSHPSSSVSHPVPSSHLLPNSNDTNQKQYESATSFSLPPNFHHNSNLQPFNVSNANDASRKPNNSRNVMEMSESCLNQSETTSMKLDNHSEYSMYSANDYRAPLEGASGFSRAVALHPPQQGEDPYSRDDQESNHSGNVSRGFFQGGQSFSPPTKQNKDKMSNSTEDLTNQSNRLNDDYSQLSERLELHGSHQQELQHYIQMLLNKSPGEVNPHEENDSMFSQDNEEFDLNDTAQAALLQKELDRIQQLREKQVQDASKSSSESMKCPTSVPAANGDDQMKILTQEQLAEVTKLLNEVKGQGQPQSEHPQVMELLELLKHAQFDKGNQSAMKKGTRPAARALAGPLGDKHRPGPTAGRRNVQFNPGKGVDSSKSLNQELNKEKAGTKCTQQKKVERKVAGGSAVKGEKGPKPNVWK